MLLLCRKDYSQEEESQQHSSAPLVIDFRTICISKSELSNPCIFFTYFNLNGGLYFVFVVATFSGQPIGQPGSMLNIMHGTWRQGKSKDVSVLVKTLERQHYENHPHVSFLLPLCVTS